MRWVRPLGLAAVIVAAVMPVARAQQVSDTYDPSWPEQIRCPAEIQGHPLTEVRAITGDDASTHTGDVGDRSIACKYEGGYNRIDLSWSTLDNPGDEAQWCSGPSDTPDDGHFQDLQSDTHRAIAFGTFASSVIADMTRMLHAAETLALPCGATTTTQSIDTCAPEGVVTSTSGPVAGIRVELHGPGDDELDATGTDAKGRYRFAAPARGDTFEPATDDVTVKVLLQDDAGVWDLWNGGQPAFMQTKPFKVAVKTCRHDVVLGRLGGMSDANPTTSPDWPPIVATLHRLQREARFTADPKAGLGFAMSHNLPVTVYMGCDDTAPVECPAPANSAATPPVGEGSPFYSATPSPHIVLGPAETAGEGLAACDSDTIPHEWGHALTADLFGGDFPRAPGSTNHAGYYGNPSSNDSWTEGFATYLGLEARKHAGGRPTPIFTWCQPSLASLDVEADWSAWDSNGSSEEWAIAGTLLDIEDGPEDYQPAQVPSAIDRAAKVIVVPGKQGRVVVGRVQPGLAGTVNVRVELLGSGDSVAASGQAAVDGDGWFYFPVVPVDVTFTSVRAYAVPNGARRGDDDPVNATPKQVWDAIAGFTSHDPHAGRPVGVTGVFDVTDLHAALQAAFGGDRNKNGVDDVDQIFRAHGLFVDAAGQHTYAAGAAIGPTTHPMLGAPAGAPAVERNDVVLPPETWVKVDTGRVKSEIVVSITYPPPLDDQGYSYLAAPAADGRIRVAMPPEESGGVVTLLAIAPGHLPEVVTTIEPAAFWKEAAAHRGQPFLDLSASLPTGDLGGSGNPGVPPLAAGFGVLGAALALGFAGRRKRVLVLGALALGAAGVGLSAWSALAGGDHRPGNVVTLAAGPSLAGVNDATSTTSAATTEATLPPSTTATPGDREVAPDHFAATAVLPDYTAPNGTVTSYRAELVGDHDGSTAWCAPGDASGELLTLTFDKPVTLSSVGLEPGYDKVDTASGRDRWDENRHVTSVTYVFDDNTRVSVTLDGTRGIQQHQLDAPITTTSVEMVIDATTGIGDTCISEAAVRGKV